MHKKPAIALFFIAACALSTGTFAQKTVYRCGSHYSQVPCDGAVSVDTRDARTRYDKAQADKATQRDLQQAKDMEKARLREEKDAALDAQAAVARERERADAKAHEKLIAPEPVVKKPRHKKKGPEYFTAKAIPPKKDKKPN